jgi:hypothetical protein
VRCLPHLLFRESARRVAPAGWVSRADDELIDVEERGPGQSQRHPDPMDEFRFRRSQRFLLIRQGVAQRHLPVTAAWAARLLRTRWIVRAPAWLYRARLGIVFGSRQPAPPARSFRIPARALMYRPGEAGVFWLAWQPVQR